jgi:hypothetical protein
MVAGAREAVRALAQRRAKSRGRPIEWLVEFRSIAGDLESRWVRATTLKPEFRDAWREEMKHAPPFIAPESVPHTPVESVHPLLMRKRVVTMSSSEGEDEDEDEVQGESESDHEEGQESGESEEEREQQEQEQHELSDNERLYALTHMQDPDKPHIVVSAPPPADSITSLPSPPSRLSSLLIKPLSPHTPTRLPTHLHTASSAKNLFASGNKQISNYPGRFAGRLILCFFLSLCSYIFACVCSGILSPRLLTHSHSLTLTHTLSHSLSLSL